MESPILHSYRRCPFAIRVRMVLEEKGIAYELREESLKAPSAELLQGHPEGKVPLLWHQGQAIYESSVITEYVDEAFPGPRFTPSTPAAKARMRLWTYWCNTAFKPDLDSFKYRRPLDPAAALALRQSLEAHLQKIEAALENGPYLLGQEITLADLHVFPFVRQLSRVEGVDFLPSRVRQWLDGVMARPSFACVMEKKEAHGK